MSNVSPQIHTGVLLYSRVTTGVVYCSSSH